MDSAGCDIFRFISRRCRILDKVKEQTELELLDVINYYESKIKPYKYIYRFKNNLTLEFQIEEDQICHLLIGTLPKGMANKCKYKGQEGYKNIKSGILKLSNLPPQIDKRKVKNRCRAFLKLDKILQNPKAIIYNPNIIKKGSSIKLGKSVLQAEYLFYKIIDEKIVHVFLRNDNKSENIVVVSLFEQAKTKDEYITDQVNLEVVTKEKELVDKK